MSRIDLNIVDRGTQGTDWIAEDIAITAKDLDEVKEMKTDNTGALNSLPTPFARFFVAREAFRRRAEEYTNSKKEAGMAYSQMVSDILDVYELLFNLKYHRNNTWKRGERLEIREWDSASNLEYIKKKMPVLYNSLHEYYKTDIMESKLYFVVYTVDGKDMLLACSSPLTGFVTPPDLDKIYKKTDEGVIAVVPVGEQYKNLHILRKSGGEYFREPKPFEARDKAFKNYMYHVLFGGANIDERLKELQNYIRRFQNDDDIRNDYAQKLSAVKTDENADLVINGLAIQSVDEVDVHSFFRDTIIRLPYRINPDNFKTLTYRNDRADRKYDYLLPFTPDIVNLFDDGEVNAEIQETRQDITVYLKYKNEVYTHRYATEPILSEQGKIIDLCANKISFDIGLFPNILSPRNEENNYFKVLVIGADEDPAGPVFNIDQISLSFYNGGKHIGEIQREDNDADYGVYPAVVRSKQKSDQVESGTKFYELFNTAFDMIEVQILDEESNLLIPRWTVSQQTNEAYTYAIDLGTSNTFMSRCRNTADGMPDLSRKPELFRMDKPMVSYIHETSDNTQKPLARRIEEGIFSKGLNRIKTEFLPPIIDGKVYTFPIRTAVCGIQDRSKKPRLFDNQNIAFFYEKMMLNDDQVIHTDIKWTKNEDMLRIFVRELLLIVKSDILQRGGDLRQTNLVWFSPLSFSGNEKILYEQIWTEEPMRILSIDKSQIRQFSESEAPYYYYKKMAYIKDTDAVTVIDIGGGSTDFVYFRENKPIAANSVHFGCDILWENGYNEFEDVRDNGIYQKYADTISFRENKELADVYTSMKEVDGSKTKDIINFWLSNDKDCNISAKLRSDFQPVFVYHLTSILYYMACMYKDYGYMAPRSIVFSGNGSKYIDHFITNEGDVLKEIINTIFNRVFGGSHDVNLKLPDERKESTCYGGLYRDADAPRVKSIVYQGDVAHEYKDVGEITSNLEQLKVSLARKYKELSELYKEIFGILQNKGIIVDNIDHYKKYTYAANKSMDTSLSSNYRTLVEDNYGEKVAYNDSVFFIPIVERIFEMTKL